MSTKQEVSDVVEAFLRWMMVERGRAVNTVTSYRRDLARYETFLASRDVDVVAAGDDDVEAFIRHLQGSGEASASTARRLAAVAANVCASDELGATNAIVYALCLAASPDSSTVAMCSMQTSCTPALALAPPPTHIPTHLNCRHPAPCIDLLHLAPRAPALILYTVHADLRHRAAGLAG